MNIDLIVIWNGAHRGCDADLLSEGLRVPEKLAADLVVEHRSVSIETVTAALPTLQSKALTFREILAITGCSASMVNNALFRLRQDGLLRSTPIAGAPGGPGRGRPPLLYWRWPR